jgi:hypothetical protein
MRIGPYPYLIVAAVGGTATALSGWPWVTPILQTALAYPVLYRDLTRSDLAAAVRHMLFWAFVVSLCTIAVTAAFPDAAARAIPRGEAYRIDMFEYIRTGIGSEGDPARFLPEHALHYAVTLAISFVTIAAGGLFLGSFLLGYMNYYVGSLITQGERPLWGAVFGWPIWSMVRVAAFVLGAIAFAHLAHALVLKRSRWDGPALRALLIWSSTLFLSDIVIKGLLAHQWRHLLERALLP